MPAPIRTPFLPVVPQALAATGALWPTEPLRLDWLKALDGRLSLTAAGLSYGGLAVDQPALRLRLSRGELVLDQMDGSVPGGPDTGKIGATGRLKAPAAEEPAQAAMTLTVIGAKATQPLTGQSALDVTGGIVDFDLALDAAGRSVADLVADFHGKGRLLVRDGVLKGFDLGRIAERLNKPSRPVEAAEALSRAVAGGQTPFKRLEADFTAEGGVFRTDDLRLTADSGEATASGSFDLTHITLDLETRFKPALPPDLPGFAVAYSGALDRPQRSLKADELIAALARRAESGAVDRPARIFPGGGLGDTPIGHDGETAVRGVLERLRR
jgi:uncharacterized protein involved in outer membrane biogenesis